MNKVIDFRIFKFGIVGLSGMILDFTITWFCKEQLQVNLFFANALGFSVAVFSNFFFNRVWTFEQQTGNTKILLFRFIFISITGLLLNSFLLYLFKMNSFLNFYILKIIVTGIVFCWNYLLNVSYTFK